MKIKNLFKSATTKITSAASRKEGGTFIGNALRVGANVATKGILGNGVMLLKPGQTPEENNQLAKEAISDAGLNAGFGISLANQTNDGKALVNTTAPMMDKIKKMAMPLILGFIIIGGLLIAVFKRKKINNA